MDTQEQKAVTVGEAKISTTITRDDQLDMTLKIELPYLETSQKMMLSDLYKLRDMLNDTITDLDLMHYVVEAKRKREQNAS
jgi:type IV secretory pathway VirB4 component